MQSRIFAGTFMHPPRVAYGGEEYDSFDQIIVQASQRLQNEHVWSKVLR
jgi:hypothetical protein